jgi:hypothetical protein
MGEFKVATNYLFLFPYHGRVFVNKNTLTSDYKWGLGLCPRNAYFTRPQVLSVKGGYERAKQVQAEGEPHAPVFKIERWNYIHIEIPIFKYPVIDMISIFVPLVILACISMFIFGQESG